MKALVVKNISREGPGAIASVLRKHRIRFDVVDLARGSPLPDPIGYDAVYVMGGPSSANDGTALIGAEREFVKKTADLGIPYLGTCLGAQILVVSCGGSVVSAKDSEVGWRNPANGEPFEMVLNGNGKQDPLFEGMGNRLRVFHLHGEMFVPAPRMRLLATGSVCHNQAVKVGKNAYGIQGHLELTDGMFGRWLREDTDLRKLDASALRADYKAAKEEYRAVGARLFANFLRIAGFVE